ncbi:helix-turn-helix domain-containing protein [Sporosarcina sp. ACRSL]|uniref:helix-turn-helix domain-containing protein n=1 Tax=Sporosarcina sp. ACRSL TaxID=2918215 RepID=UPI001EF62107|nr:helix-turn-helix domain-containing protein [Sporosarcina sp. ACRSL]MCG7346395.1 helix-turn-helix domain-containing protein [Sporosarcina sp. ACRSL]
MTKNSQQTQPNVETEVEKTESASKALPFAVNKGWTGVPNSIFTVYTKHPEINATAIMVYTYLLRLHNDDYGYAYPSQVEMAINFGVTTGTIKNAVARLRNAGLITTKYNIRHSNNNYFFNRPVETVEELLEKFPEIEGHLKKLEEKAQKTREEAEAEKERLAKTRQKKAES